MVEPGSLTLWLISRMNARFLTFASFELPGKLPGRVCGWRRSANPSIPQHGPVVRTPHSLAWAGRTGMAPQWQGQHSSTAGPLLLASRARARGIRRYSGGMPSNGPQSVPVAVAGSPLSYPFPAFVCSGGSAPPTRSRCD